MKYLGSQDNISSRHASWIAYLQQFAFVIKHQSCRVNKVADALSRQHSLIASLSVSVPGFATFAELYPSDQFLVRSGRIYSLVFDQNLCFMNDSYFLGPVFASLNATCAYSSLPSYMVKGMLGEIAHCS